MSFYNCVSADVYEAAVAACPADRATLNHRRRKVAEHRLQQSHGLCWGAAESLNCVSDNTGIPECMGVALVLLYLQFLLLKWRKHKGTHPTASRYASHCAAVYGRISSRVHRVYRRKKRALLRKAFRLRLWGLVYYWLAYGKLMRTIMTCKRKLVRTIDRGKLQYMKVTFSIYRCLPSLRVSAAVIFLGLFMSGDIELNPGPKQLGQLTIDDLKVVRSTLWEARTSWKSIGIELDIKVSSLNAITADHSGRTEDCFTEMLVLWLKQVDPMPNWSTIVAALKQPTVGQHEVAVRAEKVHCTEEKAGSASAVHKLTFPYIKEIILDESTRFELEEKLRVESKIIIQSFHILRFKFIESLEKQKVPVEKLVKYLKDEINDPLLSGKSTTFEDVEDVIRKHTSFFDYQLINYMIKLAGTDEDKESLKEYETDFMHYAQRRVYECPTMLGNPDATASELHIKLDSRYDEYTLNELKEFQYRLCLKLNLSIFVCRLLSIEKGCILAIFLIPPTDRDSKFPLSRDQEKDLMEFGIQKLTCGDYKFQAIESDIEDLPKSVKGQSSDQQTSTAEPVMSYINYLSSALSHLNEQKQYFDIGLHSEMSSAYAVTVMNSLSYGHEISKEVQVQDEVNVEDQMKEWNEAKRKYDESDNDSAYSTTMESQHSEELIDSDIYEIDDSAGLKLIAAIRGGLNNFKKYFKQADFDPKSALLYGGYSILHLAVVEDQLDVVKFLIESADFNPSCLTSMKRTPLHLAAQYCQLEIVRYLVCHHFVKPSVLDQNGLNALHHACVGGNLDSVKLLIEEMSKSNVPVGDIITEKSHSGNAAIHYAAERGHTNIVRFIIQKLKCDPNIVGVHARTPLHVAAKNGHVSTAKFLIEDCHNCKVDCRDEESSTPIHLAALNGHLDIVKCLTFENICDPASKNFFNAITTALHAASLMGHLHIVKFLVLEKHCDPECRDILGNTPLHAAALDGQQEIVKYLVLEKICNPSCTNAMNATPLLCAVFNGHLEILKFLVENHSDPTQRDCLNYTPLHYAALNGHIEIVKFLTLQRNCDPTCTGIGGDTPLHAAALNGHLDIVKFLIQNKDVHCDPTCEDVSSATPLHAAALNGHLEVVKFLVLEQCCNPSCRNSLMYTPLHIAALQGHSEVVKFLIHYDPACRTASNLTPLHLGIISGSLETVKLLLGFQNLDDLVSIRAHPMFVDAIVLWLEVVALLASEIRSNPLTMSNPNMFAALYNCMQVIQCLIHKEYDSPQCRESMCIALNKMLKFPTSSYATSVRLSSLLSKLDILNTSTTGTISYIETIRSQPLHIAAENGHLKIVKYFVEEKHCNPSCEDKNKVTPLYLAALNGHLETVKYLALEKHCDPLSRDSSEDATPLHVAALNGHFEIVKFLTSELMCDPNIVGWSDIRRTPLHNAAQNGHFNIVKYLVEEKHCDPSCEDKNKVTPLYLAALNGHLETVKYLALEKHCDPLSRDSSEDATPLHVAALNGHFEIVKFLTSELMCDPNIVGWSDIRRTPLHNAAQNGHFNIVKYLVEEKHCDPSCEDKNKVTPLYLAALNGHLETVKYLALEKHCDPLCKESSNNTTPLHIAALNGHFEVVKFLTSEMMCDAGTLGWSNMRTPLLNAAQNGHLGIVKYLIEEKHCNPSCEDKNKVTPLHLAAGNGHLETVKYLALEKHCDPLCRDSSENPTPLHAAAFNGHFEVVKFLTSEMMCDANTLGWNVVRMPLHYAAENGHLDIVKYLVEEKKCDPSCEDKNKVTPLHLAAFNGHLETVKYLALEKHCDPLCREEGNDTPMHAAAAVGHLNVVKFFVSDLNCDCNVIGSYGNSLIHNAAYSGCMPLVKYLIEEKMHDPQMLDNFNHTPLMFAAQSSLPCVKYFINKGCDCYMRDIINETALEFAAFGGQTEILDYFISEYKFDPCARSWLNRIPLHFASENGHLSLVQHLITNYGCNPESVDDNGDTPLHCAATNGQTELVHELVLQFNCDPFQTDSYGNTPLHDAARNGHLEIVKFLVEVLAFPTHLKGSCGMSPLSCAMFKGHFHVVKYLKEHE